MKRAGTNACSARPKLRGKRVLQKLTGAGRLLPDTQNVGQDHRITSDASLLSKILLEVKKCRLEHVPNVMRMSMWIRTRRKERAFHARNAVSSSRWSDSIQ